MVRAQTATEYLILTAFVIVIAIIVVSLLGGIPNISGGTSKGANDAKLSALSVGIADYSISDYDTTFTVRNNRGSSIDVTNIEVNNEWCSDFQNFTLLPGKSKQVICASVFEHEQSSADFAIAINYTDRQTNAKYEQYDDDHILVEPVVAEEYNAVLENTASYSASAGGCWNWSALGETGAICTCIDLQNISASANRRYSDYIMMNNIDMQRCADTFGGDAVGYAANWTPIGDTTTAYNGTFDGQNRHVKGITIVSGGSSMGLFGDVDPAAGASATIQNIGVVDFDISGTSYLGGLAGLGYSATITNSYSTGTVNGTSTLGGLVGYGSSVTITNSYSTGTVNGTFNLGGLVGYGLSTTITDSYSTGSVNGTSNLGGLVGYGSSTTITDSYSARTVNGTSFLGGLVGYGSSVTITDSYSTGTVNGTSNLGGLVGYGFSATITDSYSTGSVNGTGNLGGLVGYGFSATITDSYSARTVDGTNTLGGLVGYGSSVTITDSYSTGTVDGTNTLGGLVGFGWSATITDSYSQGSVFCSDAATGWCGGLVGRNNTATQFNGALTWTNATNDNATDCVGVSGQLAGMSVINCSVAS